MFPVLFQVLIDALDRGVYIYRVSLFFFHYLKGPLACTLNICIFSPHRKRNCPFIHDVLRCFRIQLQPFLYDMLSIRKCADPPEPLYHGTFFSVTYRLTHHLICVTIFQSQFIQRSLCRLIFHFHRHLIRQMLLPVILHRLGRFPGCHPGSIHRTDIDIPQNLILRETVDIRIQHAIYGAAQSKNA